MTTPTPTTVQVKIQLRRDTSANWSSVNPVLLAGEAGLETDTSKIKIGNGSTAWNSLGYFPFVVSGGTVTGNLEIGTTGTLTFEGSSADNFETTLGVINPTADRTINLPNVSGTIITTGDTGTVTSTMIADGTIVDADVSATAEIAVSKLADGAARQLLQTDAAGTGVEWTSNIDIPGTLDVTGAATFDAAVTVTGDLTVNGTTTTISTQNLLVEDKNIIIGDVATPTDTTADGGGITLKGTTDKTINWVDSTDAWTSSERFSIPLGSAASPTLTFTGDPNTGIYSPGANQVAISTGGSGRLFVDASGNVGVGVSAPVARFHAMGGARLETGATGEIGLEIYNGSRNTGISSSFASSTTFIDHNQTLVFRDSQNGYAERLRITSAGLVGIGTSSPQVLLDVWETSTTAYSSSATTAKATVRFNNNADGGYGSIILNALNGSISGVAQNCQASINCVPEGLNTRNTSLTFGVRRASDGQSPEVVRIDSSGRVGIGTTSPTHSLDVNSAIRLRGAGASTEEGDLHLYYVSDSNRATITSSTNGAIVFENGIGAVSERARIDSSGRLLVGTSSARSTYLGAAISAGINVEAAGDLAANNRSISVVNGFAGSTDGDPIIYLGRTRSNTVGGTTIVQNGDNIGRLEFVGSDGTNMLSCARIMAFVDGTPGANDMPGRLVFSTTADGASSPTERMRITSGGYLKASNNGAYNSSTATYHEHYQTSAGDANTNFVCSSSSYTGGGVQVATNTAAGTGFSYYRGYSSGFTDTEFNLRGDGTGLCDGSWTGGGADYAEYFEWSDSNPDAEDRRGISVVLDGDKIREAVAGEDPIGVISGNPSVVGDAAWNKWSGKYLRDEFGTYIQEDYEVEDEDGNTVIQQRRKLNPAYDPDVEYTSREKRPEWDCVGLMGKLRIRKGQVTGSRWIKMRDINDSVEEWLVR